jgi:murein DD-endopeptidase MepM/ murein hydrolase activator NlpD
MKKTSSLRVKRSNPGVRAVALDCFVAMLFVMTALGVTSCTQSGAPVVRYGQLEGAGTTGIHTIESGDTVGRIAARYNLDIRDILVVNHLQAPFTLKPGERLKLPAPRTYRVRGDDTLYEVAQLFHASPSQLVRLNNLSAPYALRGGQILKLPVVEDTPKPQMVVANTSMPPMMGGQGVSLSAPSARIDREELSAPMVSAAPIVAPSPGLAQPALAQKVPSETPARSGSGKFMVPVMGPVLSSYGPKPGGLHNDGVNIKAPKGAPVRAAENGVIVYVGSDLKGYGTMVLIRHADKWMTAYAHLGSVMVKKGAIVKRGETIGLVGSSGNVDQPQLHFEIRHGTDALNPEKFT